VRSVSKVEFAAEGGFADRTFKRMVTQSRRVKQLWALEWDFVGFPDGAFGLALSGVMLALYFPTELLKQFSRCPYPMPAPDRHGALLNKRPARYGLAR
jgi:hypothetical protein